jgi:hypothetical protein
MPNLKMDDDWGYPDDLGKFYDWVISLGTPPVMWKANTMNANHFPKETTSFPHL